MKLNKVIVVALLIVTTLCMVACSEKTSIIGKWDLDINSVMALSGIDVNSISEFEKSLLETLSATMEFKDDGTCEIVYSGMGTTESESFPYKVENNKIYIEGSPADYEINGDVLNITENGFTLSMTRVK